MEPTTTTHLLGRQLQGVVHIENSKLNLSVLQWNVLARCYTSPKHYPLLSRQIVEFDNRKDLISQEIKSYNADVICLQEVDKKDSKFFRSLYPEEEYSFSFVKKPQSSDGTCIMIKKNFGVIEAEIVEHINEERDKKDNLVSQIVVAKHSSKEVETYLIVAACHLKADGWTVPCGDIRLRQAKQLIEAIEKQKEKCWSLAENKEKSVIVIVCGDFNDHPENAPTQEFLKNPQISMKSAFIDEPYTLNQMYGYNEYWLKSVVDYVLYSDNLVLSRKIKPPAEGKVGPDGLLSENFPSDHLSLYCEFVLPA